tara:strand:- start:8913 stop:9110 length:198 start_codon:yes stop_codon:yes gene_type:complete
MQIENFIGINIWLQYKIAAILLGIILGLVNPTVLIYWVLIISFLNKKNDLFEYKSRLSITNFISN